LIIILCFAIPAFFSYLVAKRMATESRKRYHEVGIAVFLESYLLSFSRSFSTMFGSSSIRRMTQWTRRASIS
jgi:hypothetical protein